MRIATWNVNSIRSREANVAAYLARIQPDLLLLQEIKCEAPQFPADAFPGYEAHVVGQKSYNGVAILARIPIAITHRALPGMPPDDAQARYIEAEAQGVAIGNLYLPNGNSGGDDGYAYKLRWMQRLADRARTLLGQDRPCLFAGDYNVAPAADDHAPGALSPADALIRPETRAAFRALLWQGLADAVRALQPAGRAYTFWDYQANAWGRDSGLRIDHALLSPVLAERLVAAAADKSERARPKPSDHVPLLIELQP